MQKIDDIPQGSNYSGVRKKPWGTAHAVWTARHVINSSFVIINADDYYGQDAFKGAAEFILTQKNDDTFALVGYKLEDTLSEFGTVSRGVCTLKDNFLKTIIERTKIIKKNGIIIDEDSKKILDPKSTVLMNFGSVVLKYLNILSHILLLFLQTQIIIKKMKYIFLLSHKK